MSEESSLGALLFAAQKQREAIEALRPLAKIGSEFEDLFAQAHTCFNAIVVKILEQHLDKLSLGLDPKKGSWENQHAILQVGYGGFQLRIPVRIIEDLGGELSRKVRIQMSKKIVVNNVEYNLPLVDDVEVAVNFSPFKPVSWSNTDHGNDTGQTVFEVAEGVYLQHYYDHSNVLQTLIDDEGEQRQEWGNLKEDRYVLVITQPEVVGKALTEFSPKIRAEFRLAEIVRLATGQRMTIHWRIHPVDVLPEIYVRSHSTAANTSNVSWGGQQISESIVLKTVDGWTGSRNETKRDLYVLRSEWLDLLYQ